MTVPANILPSSGGFAAARAGILQRFLGNRLSLGALVMLGLITLVAIFAPLLTPHDPLFVDGVSANTGPSSEHLLGADSSGRDILSRLIIASRTTLAGALVAVLTAAAIGIPTGLTAGYFQGFFELVGTWVSNVLLALPNMIVLLAVIAAYGPGLVTTMMAFGVILSPAFYRIVRGQVLTVRGELYVDAARVSGLSNMRIIGRHVLGVVRAPIIIQASVVAGSGIIVQAGLGFLGFVDASTPTWGGMLGDAFLNMYLAPTAIIWPGLAIAITVACLVLVANGLRDALQSTARAARRVNLSRQDVPPATCSEPAALLSVEDVKIAYPGTDSVPNVVVENAHLSVRPGEVLGVVGESGSGKTQTAFSILGLLPTGGQVIEGGIFLEGVDVTRLPPAQRCALLGTTIGYIPQEPMSNLDPAFRIGYQLTEPLRARHGFSRADSKVRALELLARVGIADPEWTFKAYPHQISGGMAQRVLIAGAVAGKPKLLIADEPTTALDVTVQAEVLDLLRELQEEMGMAMVLVTHSFGVVADICERVVVMHDGRVVETAKTQHLYDNAQNPYSRMLLRSTLEDAPVRGPLPRFEDISS